MEYKCSICEKPLSRAMSVSNNYVSKTTDMICMSCMKEIDPIAYLFVLQSIERQLKLINKQRNNTYLTQLRDSMNSYKKELINQREKLTNFNKNTNLNLLKSKLNNKEHRLVEIENRVNYLQTNIKKNKSKYRQVTEQLKNTDKFITIKESISYKSLQKLREIFKNNEINDFTTESEQVNPQYNRLVSDKIGLEQSLKVDEAELNNIQEEKQIVEDRINILQQRISEKEQELKEINQELEIIKRNYNTAENNYNQAQQNLNVESYQISMVKNPVVPQSPVSPNKKLNITIAGVLAMMMGVFIVFFREFMKEDEESRSKEIKKSKKKAI